MPSSLSNFASDSRSMRVKVEVDLDLSGTWVDVTNFLDNFTIYTSTEDKIYGLAETIFDAEFNIPNPDGLWAKAGRLIKASITISNDNWVTSHTEQLFYGTTSRQNTIPYNNVKVKATTLISNFLDKKVRKQVFRNLDTNDIIESLLIQVGVNPANITLTPSGVVLSVYFVSDTRTIREFIQDLCAPNLQIVGFNKDNQFTNSSLVQVTLSGGSYTPDLTVTLDTQLEFQNREIRSKYYANTARVKGYAYRYAEQEQLFFDNQISGQEIKPNSFLYYSFEIPNTQPLFINNFQAKNRPVSGPVLTALGIQSFSFYDFFTTDDGSGAAENSDITLVSQSVVNDNGKETIFLKFRNNSSTNSYFLKTLKVNGDAVIKTADLLDQQTSGNLEEDGQELAIEIESNAIQNDVILNGVINTININLFNYAQVYTYDMRGRPEAQIGKIITHQDRNLNNIDGIIFESDIEVSKSGYNQLITSKQIVPVNYLELDLITSGLDDPNIAIF